MIPQLLPSQLATVLRAARDVSKMIVRLAVRGGRGLPFSALAALSVVMFVAAVPGFAQTFVAEWNASAQGGIGPTGMVLATESGITYLYVCDQPRGRIIKFNAATGAVVTTFGQVGNGNGDFNSPYGIARDAASGDLYVAERGNHRVSRVTNSGAFVMAWGTQGTAVGQFNEPIGVAVDAAGEVYVTDHQNNRVQKFHVAQSGGAWSATSVTSWGVAGSGNGQFNLPYGITADAVGNIWVADGFNGRVQRFNTSGVYQSTVGSAGTAAGQFVVATWVGLDPAGNLFVTSTNSNPQDGTLADANNQWVSRFTPTGTYVSRFGGTFGSGQSQFRLPFSAVVDAANRAYVSDYYNTRIQVFDLSTTPPAGGGTGGTGGTDITAPTVANFTTGASTATTVTFQITFSESVTGVDKADFTAVTTGGATATIGTVTGSGATYSIPVTFTGTGTIKLNLNASGTGIADTAGNAFSVGASGPTFTIGTTGGGTGGPDTTAPTVAGFTVGATTATSVTFQIMFSESVTGVDKTDFAAVTTGGATATIGTVTGSGTTYSIPVTFSGTGTIKLNLNATGTGIADAASNALVGGASGPTFTIPTSGAGGGSTSGVHVSSVTPAANRTYEKNDELIFKVTFSGNVSFTGKAAEKSDDDHKGAGDDGDDEDAAAFFTWTAVGSSGGKNLSGKIVYISGSGTNTLTFRYKVQNGDEATKGIQLGTTLMLAPGVNLRDASGNNLLAPALALAWPQNPLTGVIIDAAKSNNGGGKDDDKGPAANNGKGEKRGEHFVNLSSRLRVTGGDASRSVVAGFVVTGIAPKPILIRAVGPGLEGFGIREALAQPRLQLHDSTGKVIAENEGWNNKIEISMAGDSVGAFKLQTNSHDAALLVALDPGAYTAQVTANGNGIVLVEVYDASTGTQLSTEQIVNISTRGFVGTGDDVLVAGFVVTGSTPKRVLIRGIGPGLTAFGVPGVVADPVLKLFVANTSAAVAQNDNWQTPQPVNATQVVATAAEITAASSAVGAFPLATGSKDAAIIVTLMPGNYSAVVSGAANGTGAGLVEVYELP